MEPWSARTTARARTAIVSSRWPVWATRLPAARGTALVASAVVASLVLISGCTAEQPSAAASPSVAATTRPSNTTAGASAGTLSGRWTDEKENVYEFRTAGADAYVGEVVTVASSVCAPINMKVSGTSGHYEGTMAFYKVVNTVCGEFLGGSGGPDPPTEGAASTARPTRGRGSNTAPAGWARPWWQGFEVVVGAPLVSRITGPQWLRIAARLSSCAVPGRSLMGLSSRRRL